MTNRYKICNNCGAKVDMTANFCPECKSQTFDVQPARHQAKPPSTFKQALFYWDYDGYYVLAKSKLAGLSVFLLVCLSMLISPAPPAVFLVAIILGGVTFAVGFIFHFIRGKPSEAVLENNNYGLITDIRHLMFYWQNKRTGVFVYSKTKIISFLIFVLFALISIASTGGIVLFSMITVGLVFEIPVFALGFIIHKLTNPYPEPPKKIVTKAPPKKVEEKKPESRLGTIMRKKEPEKPEVIPKFQNYETKVNELITEYNAKESVARDLIEKRFAPPQITYTRFISMVDKAGDIFKKESESALNILHLAVEDSQRIDEELDHKISVMESIIDKIEDLTNELVLSMDSSKDSDVEGLIDDMGDLISSVKDYEK